MSLVPFVEIDHYKSLIKKAIETKKQERPYYSYSNMASHCRLSKVYLSRVLNSEEKHFNSDQLYSACQFLQLDSKTRDFASLLYERDTTLIPERREEACRKIQEIRDKFALTESHIQKHKGHTVRQDELWRYHICPDMILTHLCLSVERFQSDPFAICGVIGVSRKRLRDILDTLIQLGLVQRRSEKYVNVVRDLHLSRESPIYSSYRSLMRIKSLERISRLSDQEAYNFSAVFTGDRRCFENIRQLFFEFLSKAKELSDKSPKDEVFQMTFDLFDWSSARTDCAD